MWVCKHCPLDPALMHTPPHTHTLAANGGRQLLLHGGHVEDLDSIVAAAREARGQVGDRQRVLGGRSLRRPASGLVLWHQGV